MRTAVPALAAAVALLLACAASSLVRPALAGGPVVTLGKDTFEDLTATGAWLIEFYAPWCAHCRALEPVFEEAARAAPDGTRLAKVDCTQERELQKRFAVKGFPTLVFLRDGETRPYRGARDKEGIVAFLEALSRPPVLDLVKKNRKRRTADYPVNFVFAGAPRSSPEYAVFERAARAHQARQGFLFTEDEKLLAQFGAADAAARGAVVVRLSDDGAAERFEGPWEEAADLRAWVLDNQLPLVSELSADNFYDLTGSGKLTVFAVTNSERDYSKTYLDKVFGPAAHANRDRFVFANLDAFKFESYVSQFHLDLDHGPTAFVFDFPNEVYWSPLPDGGHSAATRDGLDRFLDAVHRGELSPQTVGAWYSPARLMRWIENWVDQFDDTQLIIGSAAVGAFMLAFMFWLFCTGLPELPPKDGGGAGGGAGGGGGAGDGGGTGGAGADGAAGGSGSGLRRRKPAEPRVVEDDSEEEDEQ